MHAPSDPQLCSPQVSAMSLENHQFCNIKVRGSRTPCPNLPVGRACRSFSSQAPQVPLTDFQVSAERNQTLPSQVHTELLAGPYLLSPFWPSRALPDVCSGHRSGGHLDPVQPRRRLPVYKGGPEVFGSSSSPHPPTHLSLSSNPSGAQCYIDGPYGTPTRRIFASEHAVLIGAGIGITPFASILQSIMYRWVPRLRPQPASSGRVPRDAIPFSPLLCPGC